jgi:hypothetical protein
VLGVSLSLSDTVAGVCAVVSVRVRRAGDRVRRFAMFLHNALQVCQGAGVSERVTLEQATEMEGTLSTKYEGTTREQPQHSEVSAIMVGGLKAMI